MAADLPQNLDDFLPLLLTSDIKMKLIIGSKLFNYLEEPSNPIECSDIKMFIDGIVLWLTNSNYKVIQYGIDIITQLINRIKTDLKPFISCILPMIIDRFGDNRESIKVKTLFLIMKLMECEVISPQTLFDNISSYAFYHKNNKVKECSMKLLLLTIEEFGTNCLILSDILPMILKLLVDPNVEIRCKAFETLVDLYKHIGEKFRVDLVKKYSIPQNKMMDLMNKFDEVKSTGDLLLTNVEGLNMLINNETDCTHTLIPKCIPRSIKKPTSIVPQNSSTLLQKTGSLWKTTSSISSQAGTIDKDTFIQSFKDVNTIHIFSIKDLDDIMKKCNDSIQNSNEQWNKRVESLKKIRSLVLTGALKYEEFFNNLKYLEHSFQTSIKDLRSQVVKETCITIAFLSQHLGIKFNHFAEFIFINLIDLIPNSAKIISSSGLVTIRFILEYTHTPRIIPILANSLESKSKDIRRACCEFFYQILFKWQTQILEKYTITLQDSIKKGIADADSSARVLSRKAYWEFYKHFPKQGELLLNKLEPTYRKILLTNSESKLSLPNYVMNESSRLSSRHTVTSRNNMSTRAISAIDLQAAQRAKVYTECAALTTQKTNNIVSSQSYSKKTCDSMHQTEHIRRSRGQKSISQPTSRSGSPTSKYKFSISDSRRSSSGIPIFQNTSRESSPNCFNYPKSNTSSKQSLILSTTKQIALQDTLIQSQKTKSTLVNTLISPASFKSSNKMLRKSLKDHNDETETSENSINFHRRSSDLFYYNGLHNLSTKVIKKSSNLNIKDIVSNCESLSWNNRKLGLVNLQKYLEQGVIINEILLKRLTNVFTQMLMDSLTKGMCLYLDTLNKLIVTHSKYLEYWLYVLLVKLFNKGGSGILGSVHSKILETMEIVRSSFPCDVQLITVFKFLTDPTHTPNEKTKIIAMSYISKLTIAADSRSIFFPTIDGQKDYTTLALTKMIEWTMTNNIKQDPKLRSVAQETILFLYNLNASQITLRLSQLPEQYQEVFSGLIRIKMKKRSFDQFMSQKYQNRQSPNNFTSPPLLPDTTDIFNSKIINNSLEQTTTKVQHCSLKSHYTKAKDITCTKLETNEMAVSTKTDHYFYNYKNSNITIDEEIIEVLHDLDKDNLLSDYKELILDKLQEIITNSPSDLIIRNFKKIIKVILKLLLDIKSTIREQTIILIMCLIQKPEIVSCFYNYTELIILKLLNMCSDPHKPVVKVAENCSFILCVSLQPKIVVKIIAPLISSEEFPINLIAIKMMTRLIDKYGKTAIIDQIKEIMSGLLQGYDNPDSAVRKSTVFCMVSLHKVFDKEEFASYISCLNGAKLKLLNFYIERAQQSKSVITN